MTVLATAGSIDPLARLLPRVATSVEEEAHGVSVRDLRTWLVESRQGRALAKGQAVLYVPLTTTLYEASYSKRSVNISSEVEMALSSLSSAGITLPEPASVRAYLLEHPDILDLLLTVAVGIRERFDPGTQFSLEVYSDPEIEDKYLTLYVRQQHYGPDILERIERVSSDYDADLRDKTGWLVVTTDFQPPR